MHHRLSFRARPQYPERNARPCGDLRGGLHQAAACAPAAARPARCRWTGPAGTLDHQPVRLCPVRQLCQRLPPKSALPLCRATRRLPLRRPARPLPGPKAPDAAPAARPAASRENDAGKCVYCTPLRQKMSPERHHGGPRFQDLGNWTQRPCVGCGLCAARLSQEMPDPQIKAAARLRLEAGEKIKRRGLPAHSMELCKLASFYFAEQMREKTAKNRGSLFLPRGCAQKEAPSAGSLFDRVTGEMVYWFSLPMIWSNGHAFGPAVSGRWSPAPFSVHPERLWPRR